MEKIRTIAALIATLAISLFTLNAQACPILAGTYNGPTVPLVDPPSPSYIPPGFITDITVNGTSNFTISYTKTSTGLKTTTPATTNDPGVTLSGIGWHGGKITSIAYASNTIKINGQAVITVTGGIPVGAAQNWSGP